MALFGPSDKELKQDARKEYDKAVALKGDSRKELAYRMRIGLRARSFFAVKKHQEKMLDIKSDVLQLKAPGCARSGNNKRYWR